MKSKSCKYFILGKRAEFTARLNFNSDWYSISFSVKSINISVKDF
ncbi:hypothetical protein PAPJMNIA_PAPJMNIA_02566 [Staphylococcus aureus]|nr:Uncharacterised protein [Staphylococcus aureus]CAC8556424.1 Uncharacterised protein [Staphylococcus aureus]CAI3014122.1 hypothetical protein PAPJMNIA_PAPJMNIA_02566 [Staphylococcus aureus]CAI3023187.1 hypothetical protein PKMKNADJ_PKMKNADJ_02557 [Staphylococcus aureus]